MIPRMTEIWKPVVIPEFEGLYEVSSYGRLRRVSSRLILRPNPNRQGYCKMNLSGNGLRRTVLIHRLVLEAFVGPQEIGWEGHHVDEDKSNNRLDNLVWRSVSERTTGEKGRSKLTEVQVREILLRGGRGEIHESLAKAYGVSRTQISGILSGKSWSHIPR